MTHVVVTGAAGFIGRHLCRLLAASGRSVVGLGHGDWPQEDVEAAGIRAWKSGEVDSSSLDELAAKYGTPAQVFHLAGGSSVTVSLRDPRGDFLRSVGSTVELLDWLRREAPSAGLTAISSAAVYGTGHHGAIREDAPLRPQSPYGHHKQMMEGLLQSYAQSFGTRSVIVRLFSVYGAGLHKQLLWDLCSRLARGVQRVELQGSGEEVRDWTDVRDTVRAIEIVSPKASTEVPVINVGTGIGTPVREIARLTAAAWSGDAAPVAASFSGLRREGDPFGLQADASRLSALGFSWTIPLPQGIEDYVRWFRAQADRTA
ncbi:MAG TPA: SDR family oxidoreductase [Burkholderiaceae bacterium]|nr:SDR family oxidoreductase [Burkholderiaceae bacterium]